MKLIANYYRFLVWKLRQLFENYKINVRNYRRQNLVMSHIALLIILTFHVNRYSAYF
ncbi:hypothetical protein BOSEA31B_13380 [Hyphomicrobiales bacterium]|nr:hypothetical protein BOSEA31B_13380 [Hyphomicrobiales bacterium]CAH1699152.1 hypothetical protein BOSEA1005_12205 [Hyphomicrobiales bacterium]CAI0342938.1 hypothetical protein BO1005MUT1_210003 [Hyphomicrobiales bacterium]